MKLPFIKLFDVLPFPVNLLVITVLIFAGAKTVYWIDGGIQTERENIILRLRNRINKQKRLE